MKMFPISTKEAYGKYDSLKEEVSHPDTKALVSYLKDNDLSSFFKNTKNVLEEVCTRDHKEILDIEEDAKKQGALFSMMSGSGPTVFAIFADMEEAARAARAFEEADKEKDCKVIVCDFVYRIMEDADGRQ